MRTLENASKYKFVRDLESLPVFLGKKKKSKLSFLLSLPLFFSLSPLPFFMSLSFVLSILQQLHSHPHPCLVWGGINQGAQENTHFN